MKEIRKTSQFKKDYKRFKNDKEFVETLMGIVKLLAEGNQIPEEYNPHSLKGNWKNYLVVIGLLLASMCELYLMKENCRKNQFGQNLPTLPQTAKHIGLIIII